jgi:hypothetical protein
MLLLASFVDVSPPLRAKANNKGLHGCMVDRLEIDERTNAAWLLLGAALLLQKVARSAHCFFRICMGSFAD